MNKSLIDILWVIVASGLVFIMQAGFAMVESGLTRSKNSINVAIKNLTDLGVSTVFYWISGFALMFGLSTHGLSGINRFFFSADNTWEAVFFIFQVMFCSTSATIVSGAVAERMKFSSYIISTILLSVLIYPIFGHWVWGGALTGDVNGWLGKLGFIDFAGSTVVHSLGGWVSLALLLILGPRTGKYSPEGEVRTINGSNIPMTVLGVILLWFGWFGFNGGSTLAMNESVAHIILNTTLSAAAGMIGALAVGWPILKNPDIGLVLNGALAGLVAITAPCHAVSELDSVIIGLAGGAIMFGAAILLDKLRIDDAVGAIPVHLAAGIWGTLAVAFFGDPDLLGTGLGFTKQLAIQSLGIIICGVLAFSAAYLIMLIINRIQPLRVSLEEEQMGLNKAEHGVTTEIHDLFYVLEEQSKTGDMSLRAPIEPFTEVGQIAEMYNNVMEKLEGSTVEKGEYFHILNNVSDGMMLVDKNGIVGNYFSSALSEILESNELAGEKLDTIIEAFFPLKTVELYKEFFDIVIDQKIAWRNVERLNPLKEIEANFDDGRGRFKTKYLSFFFKRVLKDNNINRIMVIIRDITQQKLLAEEVLESREKNQAEMEVFYRIIQIDPSTLSDFLCSISQDLSNINEVLKMRSGTTKERLNEIFRYSHSIKGDSQLLNLNFITEEAQKLEDEVSSLIERKSVAGEDFVALTLIYSNIKRIVEKLINVSNKWSTFTQEFKGIGQIEDNFLGNSLESMAERLAARYGKSVRLDLAAFNPGDLSPSYKKSLKDILVQLIRNSIYHGIEEPNIRQKKGKNIYGTITICMNKSDEGLCLEYKDDGRGIDVDRLKQKSIELGLISKDYAKKMTTAQAYKLIFKQGLTTAVKADTVAGKGVGMPLVYSIVKEKQGTIGVRVKKNSYVEFIFKFPIAKISKKSEPSYI